MLRLIPLAILILLLIPGHWLRNTTPPSHKGATLATLVNTERTSLGRDSSFTLKRVWQITGPEATVGGYSALVLRTGGLVLFSDVGTALAIDLDDNGVPTPRGPQRVARDLSIPKWDRDIEAATRDPNTGEIWLALESTNSIRRLLPNLAMRATVQPEAMRDWGENSGPEAMVRLADGRFVVLREGWVQSSSTTRPGVVFAGDPTEDGVATTPFTIELPDGYSPTDMAQLPDGRVLILLRAIDWGLPPRFETRMIVASPEVIDDGANWSWEMLDFAIPKGLRENFEGLAVGAPRTDGAVPIWLISDNNFAAYQRSLLVELEWHGAATADEEAPKPNPERAKEKGAPAP